MFAIPILAAIATASVKKAMIKRKNYINFPQIWGTIVNESGTNKTLPGTISFAPIRERDKETFKTYEKEKEMYNSEDKEAKRPTLTHLTTQDSTFEGLSKSMVSNNGKMCYNSDELDIFLQSIAGRYKASSDVGHYLSMFDNQQVSIHRAGKDKEPILIESPILSIYGTIQPEVLKKSVTEMNLIDNGFLQRFLFVYPERIIEQHENGLSIPEDVINGYSDFINSLMFPHAEITYTIGDSANPKFIECINEFVDMKNAVAGKPFLRSMYSKLDITFHRLCLIVEYTNSKGSTNNISLDSVNCAWALISFFKKEGEKIAKLITSNKPINKNEISKGELCRHLKKEYPNKKPKEIADFLEMKRQNFNNYLNR
jgi:hypothetical protein